MMQTIILMNSRKKFKNKYFQFNQLDFCLIEIKQSLKHIWILFARNILNFKSTIYRLGTFPKLCNEEFRLELKKFIKSMENSMKLVS